MTDLSIILPTFNERENIGPLLARLGEAVDELDAQVEILVVDDASPDGTAEAVRLACAHDARIRVIMRTQNRGLARGMVWSGLRSMAL